MLKKITLVNFMSHERTELELHQGVNVLVGPNNCGKSAIVEALRAVCEHTKRNFMIRHGEKRCHVIVETIEGDVIEWQRTKTSAKFLLNDEEIARIGRGELPAKLHQLLRMPKVRSQDKKGLFDVHLGLQKDPIFLLDEPGSKIATFFASASDAHYLLAMQELHKHRLSDARKDCKRLTKEIEEKSGDLKDFEPLDRMQDELQTLATERKQIQQNTSQQQLLVKSAQEQRKKQNQLERLQARANLLELLEEPPQLFPTVELKHALERINRIGDEHQQAERQQKLLVSLQDPPQLEETADIASRIAKLTKQQGQLAKVKAQLAASDTQLDECRQRIREFAREQSVCPHCERPWSETEVLELVEKGESHDP